MRIGGGCSVSQARTDAGLIFLDDGPVALCALTAENEERMRRWQAGTVEGRRDNRAPRPELALGDDRVRERFAAYMRHFDLAPERGRR